MDEATTKGIYTGSLNFSKTASACPNESIDSAKLLLTHFRQMGFGIAGGGDLFFREDHSAEFEYWSLIHHQHFLGQWKIKNDTLSVYYYESREDFQCDSPGIDFTEQYVMAAGNLFAIDEGQRDTLAFVNAGEKSVWEGPPRMAWPVTDDRK